MKQKTFISLLFWVMAIGVIPSRGRRPDISIRSGAKAQKSPLFTKAIAPKISLAKGHLVEETWAYGVMP